MECTYKLAQPLGNCDINYSPKPILSVSNSNLYNDTCSSKEIHRSIHKPLFTIVPNWKPSNVDQSGEWINMSHIHRVLRAQLKISETVI